MRNLSYLNTCMDLPYEFSLNGEALYFYLYTAVIIKIY